MRTILFSFSSQPVFKNLFFLPGCAFEQIRARLKSDTNLRVVFVLPDFLAHKYPQLFDGALSDRCMVEYVKTKKHLTFLQRVFRFFYSYLIYTSTTKLLATMGTRPDEMPPGGRLLAPCKLLIASTLGRSRMIKTKVTPFLFNRMFQERPFTGLFEKYGPELIFLPNIYGWFDTLLLREARERGIKTIGMPANWDHIDKYFMPFRVDHLLTQNDQMKAAAMREQCYLENQISLVGYPHFDFISGKTYLMSRADMLRYLGFPPHARFILYISGSVYCPDEPDIIEELLKWADEKRFAYDTYVVIRPYLGGRFKDKDFDEKKFNRFVEHPRVYRYQRPSWTDLDETKNFLNIMAHADVIVTAFSTAALETAVLDRPLVGVGFDGYHLRPLHRSVRRFEQFTHFRDVSRIGAIKIARNFDDLFRFVDDYMRDPKLDADKRQLLREKLCYKLDGKASERIVDFVFKK